jgi:molybdenum cofactor cytidylyltransferase
MIFAAAGRIKELEGTGAAGQNAAVEETLPLADTTQPRPRIAVIILAAGRSRRMGRAKALLPLDGKPLLAHVIDTAVAAEELGPVVVVTGHEPGALEPILVPRSVRAVHNENFEQGGMLSSVQAGVAAVAGEADAAFVMLADQPLVRVATLRTMASAYRARRPRVIVPTYGGKRGHPVLMCGRGFVEILALTGDATLKTYTAAQAERTLELPADDAAVLDDLDTPADYADALRRVAPPSSYRETLDGADAAGRSEACPSP